MLNAALFGAGLGACHEADGRHSNSTVQKLSAADRAPATSAPTADAAIARLSGASLAGQPGSASEAVASAAPIPSAASAGASRTDGSAGGPTFDAASGPPPGASSNANSNSTPRADEALALVDAQGKPLPQTDQRPSTSSPAFRQRIEVLAEAIVRGDAEPALGSFFPLVAYRQVKDLAKPERDYKFRLLTNFRRDVLEYHRALGAEAAQARFTGITVSEKDARWMESGSEGNKLGYFRVLRARLHFALPAGRSRDFELTSLISWRGEWYVVHLHGFK
jgi:hypothetical protein